MSCRIVQFTQLGNFGRFGNQLFQYVFARAYAEAYDATLEIPNWIGEKIFKNVSHASVSKRLPMLGIDVINWGDVNIDLCGYFQTARCFDFLSESKIRQWLQFKDHFNVNAVNSVELAAHLRIGDYKTLWPNVFCQISEQSYIDCADQLGIPSENITWVSEEGTKRNSQFDSISYQQTPGCMYGGGQYNDKGISFLPDFFTLMNAKVLLRSNSSFSFWAGFFNTNRVMCPVVENRVGLHTVKFAEGNSKAICGVTSDIIFGE